MLYAAQVTFCLCKHKKVYKTVLNFLSMLFVELSIIAILAICCFFYIWEEVGNLETYLSKCRSFSETVLTYVLISFIGLSILTELTKVLVELWNLGKRICRKRTPEDDLKQLKEK